MGVAQSLEGLARHASTHAAGIVISEQPLTDHVPLYKGPKDEIVTQYSMGDVEKIGLVKFDFLGFKTLTMIHRAEDADQSRGVPASHPWSSSRCPSTTPRPSPCFPQEKLPGSFSWKAPACAIC